MIPFLIGIIIFGLGVLLIVTKFGPRFGSRVKNNLNQEYFEHRWLELLARVKTSPEGMVLAVIDADKLVDEALKKCRFKGKTAGERLVAAQRSLSDNDGVWYAHKLRNRLVHEPGINLKKSEAQSALQGFRQALKDLGAI